jgi:hypothetical protein
MVNPKDIMENIEKIEKSHTYQSGLRGAVDEAGKALTTVGQAVNAVLLPVQGLIWGADKVSVWMNERVAEKLKDVPPENIIPPNPHVAGPAIEALKFTAQESELREMFAELLANSINNAKSSDVHPSFVELIKSMNGIDASLIKELANTSPVSLIDIGVKQQNSPGITYISRNVTLLGISAGIKDPWRSIAGIENLERMGLCVIIKHTHLSDESSYNKIKDHPDVKKLIDDNTKDESVSLHLGKGAVEITRFGKVFVSSCMA